MAMSDKPAIPLYLFAKQPLAGQVKTRMQPHISQSQSAELAVMMLERSMERAFQGWPGVRILSAAPDCNLALFDLFAERYQFRLEDQVSGNLGARMSSCLAKGIHEHGAAAVMGCDIPQISTRILSNFYKQLMSGEDVVGPAEDGGFYFLGLHRFSDVLFKDIRWGESSVLSALLRNSDETDVVLHPYSPLRDIDTWADLDWLATIDDAFAGFRDAGTMSTTAA